MAMVSLVFAEYLFRAVRPDQDVSDWHLKGAALLAMMLITWLNCIGTKMGAGIGNVFLVLKLLGLFSIALLGLVFLVFTGSSGHPRGMNPTVASQDSTSAPSGWSSFGNFTDAVLAALFAYGGWESVCTLLSLYEAATYSFQVSFIVGEFENPHETLPRVLQYAMATVLTLFLSSTSALYLIVLPEEMETSNAVTLVLLSTLYMNHNFHAKPVCRFLANALGDELGCYSMPGLFALRASAL